MGCVGGGDFQQTESRAGDGWSAVFAAPTPTLLPIPLPGLSTWCNSKQRQTVSYNVLEKTNRSLLAELRNKQHTHHMYNPCTGGQYMLTHSMKTLWPQGSRGDWGFGYTSNALVSSSTTTNSARARMHSAVPAVTKYSVCSEQDTNSIPAHPLLTIHLHTQMPRKMSQPLTHQMSFTATECP